MAGLYIHIPFCKQKCHYCNFFSLATTKHRVEIKEALLKEMDIRKDFLNGDPLKTIYFGGGTPSLYQPEVIEEIIREADRLFGIEKSAEITLEANPDDITTDWLRLLRNTSVNRLSIGIQSFQQIDLEYLHRIHNAEEALRSIKMATDMGFDNLSLDLIFGIPTLENEKWVENLEIATALGVGHISAYALTVEPGTALDLFIRKGKYQPVDELKTVEQFNVLMDVMLKSAFEQYEISNFAKNKSYARHNTSYWMGEKYLGIGPSAHSYDKVSRFWNVASLGKYLSGIRSGHGFAASETLTMDQHFNEYVMTSVRTMWGIDCDTVVQKFGDFYYQTLQKNIPPFVQSGHLTSESKKIKLTEKGKLFADGIASGLFVEE
jgi:oxygen-independent coproporphyrinogen III oxidase